MYKSILWIACLLLVSTGVMAAPRSAIRDGSQIAPVSSEVGVPVSGTYLDFDAARPQKVTTLSRLEPGLPSSVDDETEVAGAVRFEATGKPRNRSRDVLVPTSSLGHAVIIGGSTISSTGFMMASDLRQKANLITRPVHTNIRLVLPQPAAPPVINNQHES